LKRKLRRLIDILFTGSGIALIFITVLLGASLSISAQMPLVLLGVLLLEAGVWGMSTKVLPEERRFTDLRDEGENIIDLMRELNSSALGRDEGSEDDSRFLATLGRMHVSVDRMGDVAAHENGKDAEASSASGTDENA
jgi:hypothetical protein